MTQWLKNNEVIEQAYTVKFFLGAQGNLQLYRAVDEDGKPCLLRVYLSKKLQRASLKNGRLAEADLLSNLQVDGISSFLGDGEIVVSGEKYHYLATNFVSGESLREKVAREGALSAFSAISVVSDLLGILDNIHSGPGVISNNNLTPDTVYLDYSAGLEIPVITDFHNARRLDSPSGSIEIEDLSLFFAAPELLNGIATPQGDIFSAGAILHFLIFGFPPWFSEISPFVTSSSERVDAVEKLRRRPLTFSLEDQVGYSDVHLEEAIGRAVALDPDSRFANACEFLAALQTQQIPVVSSPENRVANEQRAVVKEGEGFAAIAGMVELKELLNSSVIRAIEEKEVYAEYGLTIPNGMLLYGPPGCGKTYIAEKLAEEIGFNMMELKPSDIKSKYINATEENIGKLFSSAIEKAPTIIFIDEFDAVVPSRDSDLHQMHASTVNEMLAQMSNCGDKGVFVIAATNRPDMIDPAIMRTGRLDRVVYVPPPDKAARTELFSIYLKNRPIAIDVDFELLGELTENYVASDIKFLVDESSRRALLDKARISQALLEEVISEIGPSISKIQLEKYFKLKQEFDHQGKSLGVPEKKIGFI